MKNSWDNIKSKKDLKKFIASDLKARGLIKLPLFYQIRKPIVYFSVLLRKAEYLENTKNGICKKFICKIVHLRLKMLGAKLGFSITPNTFAPGLYIVHWGSVVISSKARIGSGARIHSCVNVSGSPIVGNNLYLGPGAIIVGDITIGDDVTIGANTVVSTSLPDGVTVLGNPGRIIKTKAV